MDRPVRQMSAGIKIESVGFVAGLVAGAGKKRMINKGEGQWRWPRRVNLAPELVLSQARQNVTLKRQG